MDQGQQAAADANRQMAVESLRGAFLAHRQANAKLKALRQKVKDSQKEFEKTENDLAALQSVGQTIGEVLRELTPEKYIVKASSGPRYVVGKRSAVSREQLKVGTRVTLDMNTQTIMRILPREVDPTVFNMISEDDSKISYSTIGGLAEQIRELRETIELPLTQPDLFKRIGIKPPKGVLLYGPPGTGKTLMARALAANMNATFLKVVASAIVDKYIGESARLIREMFGYARDHEPCVVRLWFSPSLFLTLSHILMFSNARVLLLSVWHSFLCVVPSFFIYLPHTQTFALYLSRHGCVNTLNPERSFPFSDLHGRDRRHRRQADGRRKQRRP